MMKHNTDVAICGIGATEFSKDSGRSELRLAIEAIGSAIANAGLRNEDIQGLVSFTYEGNPETAIAKNLGISELTFFSRVPYGGGAACGTLAHAVQAVATGVAQTVVCFRAFNERSGERYGRDQGRDALYYTERWSRSWYRVFGMNTAASRLALTARRYMHEYGATSEDFGQVVVAQRKHAATNPNAFFYQKPITLEDHQNSRWIVDPLHLLDCCQESDGGVAVVVTSLERARDLAQAPVVIRAAAQGMAGGCEDMATSYYGPDTAFLHDSAVAARQIWDRSGIRASDIQTAILYDHFSPFVLMQLEAYGFCGRGEARHFISDGRIEVGGALPINPHGGLIGEAYIHQMNGIAEAVRQVRGTAVNQVANVENVLVTGGPAIPTSAVVLSGDR
jgi:acetyl-CoA acetyltransferase